jgi:hypothetical protein
VRCSFEFGAAAGRIKKVTFDQFRCPRTGVIAGMRGGLHFGDKPHLRAMYFEVWHEVYGAKIIRAAPQPLAPFIASLPAPLTEDRAG